MGWPKKNEGFRLYFERKNKTYLLVEIPTPEQEQTNRMYYANGYEGIGELLQDNDPENPMLCTCNPSRDYIYKHCRRASWDEMPEVWQDALSKWINGNPEDFRGLWKMERKSA